MKLKYEHKCIMFIGILILSFMAACLVNQVFSAGESVVVAVEPQIFIGKRGDHFTLNITLDVVGEITLYAWQVAIAYNSTFINCTNVWIPPDNVFKGYNLAPIEPQIVPEHGYVLYGASLIGAQDVRVSGKHVLFQLNFTAIEKGSARIAIATKDHPIRVTQMVEWYSYIGFWDETMEFVEIPFEERDGQVIVEAKAPPMVYFDIYPLKADETTLYMNEPIVFNASRSFDADGNIVSFKWDFGDNNITTTAEPVIIHVYHDVGYFTVNLTVTDNDGLSSSRSLKIAVDIRLIPLDITPITNSLIIVVAVAVVLAVANKVFKWRRLKATIR
jgi:hypothetical protein